MTPAPASRSGPSIGQAVVLFLAGVMLFATTCFGIFGLEKGIPADLQPLVFVTPLLFIGAGVLVSMMAFVAALVRAFTRTTPAGDAPAAPLAPGTADAPVAPWPAGGNAADPVTPAMPAPLRPAEPVPPGRPTFAQALGIAAAGCVLFLSLCAGIVGGGTSGRAGWFTGPILLVLIGAALYGFGVMVLRVLQAFGGPRR